MQAGDAHQVGDAGAIEELPFLARDGALVADRERREDAGGRRRTEHRVEAIAYRLARLLHPIERRIPGADASRLGARAHITGGADAALEEPGLVIEAVRVHEPVRPAQPHREGPALAGVHHGGEQCRRVFFLRHAAIPRQQNLLRHLGLGVGPFHIELEAHAALRQRRQARHHADHRDIGALQFARQPIVHAPLRARRRPEEAGSKCSDDQHRAVAQPDRQQQRHAPRPRERWQRGLDLQQRGARRERRRCKGHVPCNAPAPFRLTLRLQICRSSKLRRT